MPTFAPNGVTPSSSFANEDGTTDLKIDVRITLDKIVQMRNVKCSVSSRDFSKYDSGHVKYQADRCKVMIEGKNVINVLIAHGLDVCKIPVLQICGTELHLLEVSLVAPGLYETFFFFGEHVEELENLALSLETKNYNVF